MTREQIGQTLEYKEPAKPIAKIHERNDIAYANDSRPAIRV